MRGPAVRGPAARGPAVRGPAARGPAVRGLPGAGGGVLLRCSAWCWCLEPSRRWVETIWSARMGSAHGIRKAIPGTYQSICVFMFFLPACDWFTPAAGRFFFTRGFLL